MVVIDLRSLEKITRKIAPAGFSIDILPEIFNKSVEFITHQDCFVAKPLLSNGFAKLKQRHSMSLYSHASREYKATRFATGCLRAEKPDCF
ncbi:MAG: hypothetical protein KGY42_05260 [Desulfobacterales bacterium]|nr:hypothetical protein [Desulfobacterales bacterium]MBS3755028.1 hypothetical protein [Desulfobacterales bacterium]